MGFKIGPIKKGIQGMNFLPEDGEQPVGLFSRRYHVVLMWLCGTPEVFM
jgi:hypothetical protein